MKQIIPFEKDIVFKTKIGELTSISLDNDLTLKGEDLIVGNFYIKGNYKMLASSVNEEEYSYKIPCEIAISDDYDTFDCNIEIDDFTYEIKNDEILCVKISVLIDNLVKKEKIFEEIEEELNILEELPREAEEIKVEIEDLEQIEKVEKQEETKSTREVTINSDINFTLFSNNNNEEKYLTYKVYMVQEEDTLEKIMEKYNVTKEQIMDYNDFDNLFSGMKLVIPSTMND